MDRGAAYDDDIYTWSQEQAAVLRRLAETRRDLPNELDLEHVAEEIEDLGKSEVRTVESYLELLLRHLIKVASQPDSPAVKHWKREAAEQHRRLRKDLKRSMFGLIEPDEIWTLAANRAEASFDRYGDAFIGGLPAICPFDLDELRGALDLDEAVARIQAAAAAIPPG